MNTEEFNKKYPEHAKLENIKEKSQFIGEFLEWTEREGIFMCKYEDDPNNPRHPNVVRVNTSISQMLAKMFDIDLAKLEDEKLLMLKNLKEMMA